MNRKICLSKAFGLWCVLLLNSHLLPAKSALVNNLDHEIKKSVVKEFPADKNSVVEINNRYGKIDVKTWDKSSVKIEAVILVKASSKSKAEEKMQEISVTADKKGNNIVAVTEFNQSNQSWWSGWWNSGSNIKIEINYDVYMPAELACVLENKYGNIYLNDLNGKVTINLKYGNLQARNINNDLIFDISYGKATVGTVQNLTGNLSYSDYRGTGANNVTITSKYSKMYLDNAKNMTATSKYDNYKLGVLNTATMTGAYNDVQILSVATASISMKYTGTEISSLSNTLTADISYGSLVVQNLKTSFKKMTVNSSYAPVKIYGTVPTKIDIEGKYFNADLGADFVASSRVAEGSSKSYVGYKGSDRTGASIKIVTKYGDVIIK